jgi:hypothetical protein
LRLAIAGSRASDLLRCALCGEFRSSTEFPIPPPQRLHDVRQIKAHSPAKLDTRQVSALRHAVNCAAFADTSTTAVAGVYAQMLAWMMAQPLFLESARAEFQQVADGWLAAYGKASGCIVVTLEEYDPLRRNKVPLVNVCRAFDVETITPFELLRRLGVKLNWQPPA